MASQASSVGFKVWGVDNVIYGPVELPDLVAWVKDERVTADTWVFSESNDTWNKAAHTPELQLFFNRKPRGGATVAPPGTVPAAALRRVKILAGMSDDNLARFVDFMEVQHARQWTEIVKQGEHGDAMFLVLEGEVRVRLIIEGKETTLVTLNAGDFFGEVALFDQGPRSADVLANTDAVLLKISASAFQKLSHSAPELAAPLLMNIGKTLTARIRADNRRYADSVTYARAGQ